LLPPQEPACQDHIRKITNVVVVVVREEDGRHALEGDAGRDKLQDHSAPRVEEEILVPDLEHRRCTVAAWVRARSSGTKQRELHESGSSLGTCLVHPELPGRAASQGGCRFV